MLRYRPSVMLAQSNAHLLRVNCAFRKALALPKNLISNFEIGSRNYLKIDFCSVWIKNATQFFKFGVEVSL